MTETAIRQALRESVGEVLERMFFIEALGPGTGEESPAIAARLTFQGDPSGALTLKVSCAAARSIAADFLGLGEDEPSDAEIAEVVRECANMICGSVLSRVENASTFRLAEPQIIPAPDPIEAASQDVVDAVELPNGTLTVMVKTERAACLESSESAS